MVCVRATLGCQASRGLPPCQVMAAAAREAAPDPLWELSESPAKCQSHGGTPGTVPSMVPTLPPPTLYPPDSHSNHRLSAQTQRSSTPHHVKAVKSLTFTNSQRSFIVALLSSHVIWRSFLSLLFVFPAGILMVWSLFVYMNSHKVLSSLTNTKNEDSLKAACGVV